MFSEPDRFGGGLEQALGGPDRRRDQYEAEQHGGGAVPESEQPPVREGRREQTAAQGVGQDDQPQSIQQSVDAALQAGVGDVEYVERVGNGAEQGERQARQHQNRPGRRRPPA